MLHAKHFYQGKGYQSRPPAVCKPSSLGQLVLRWSGGPLGTELELNLEEQSGLERQRCRVTGKDEEQDQAGTEVMRVDRILGI